MTTPHVETFRRADCVFDIAKVLSLAFLLFDSAPYIQNLTAPENVTFSEREATVEELETIHGKELIQFINEAYESFRKFGPDSDETEVVPCVVGIPFSNISFYEL